MEFDIDSKPVIRRQLVLQCALIFTNALRLWKKWFCSFGTIALKDIVSVVNRSLENAECTNVHYRLESWSLLYTDYAVVTCKFVDLLHYPRRSRHWLAC